MSIEHDEFESIHLRHHTYHQEISRAEAKAGSEGDPRSSDRFNSSDQMIKTSDQRFF